MKQTEKRKGGGKSIHTSASEEGGKYREKRLANHMKGKWPKSRKSRTGAYSQTKVAIALVGEKIKVAAIKKDRWGGVNKKKKEKKR